MGQIIESEIWFMACMCSYSYAHDEYDTGEFNASFQLEQRMLFHIPTFHLMLAGFESIRKTINATLFMNNHAIGLCDIDFPLLGDFHDKFS